MSKDSEDPLVGLRLSEIQRIRDALASLREYSPMISRLWVQVAGLYQRLAKNSKQPAGEPRNAGPYPEPAKEVTR
jgi:hypothetical protein